MNKGLVPKLVNISDTSDSESSGCSGCEKGKETERSRWRERSRSGGKSRSRSRGKSRSRSQGKSKSLWKSLSRSRSHSRSRSRGKSRSRSRGKSRSRSRGKSRSRSRDKSRSRGKSRSRSRGRSRSRSRGNSRSRSRGKSRSRSRSRGRDSHGRRTNKKYPRHSYKSSRYYRVERQWRRSSPPPRSNRSQKTLSTLGKLGIALEPPITGTATALPSYYNHMALNPTRYAQQLAKRKLIWGNKGTESEATKSSPSLWQGATFSQDDDGKLTAKFKRLMGIKTEEGTSSQEQPGQDLIKRQQELFSSMELQYEAARQATHTQRGVGLGFGAAIHPQ